MLRLIYASTGQIGLPVGKCLLPVGKCHLPTMVFELCASEAHPLSASGDPDLPQIVPLDERNWAHPYFALLHSPLLRKVYLPTPRTEYNVGGI